MATTTVITAPTAPTARKGRGRASAPLSAARRESRSGWLLGSPFLILYALFLFVPLLYGIVMSFFNTSVVSSSLGSFEGFNNYLSVLTTPDFWASMWHTVLFTLYTTPPLVILALLFAVLTERLRAGRWFVRFAFFAPYLIPSASVVLVWTWIYTPQTGLASSAVSFFGLTPPNWTGSASWAMISVAILTVWWTLGFNYILYLAALQDVPRELYESSALDGVGQWKQLWYITLPLVRRTTMLVLGLQIIASLKIFDQIYLLTGGGPSYSTRPALEYIYDVGFTDFRAGYAAAASVVYLLVLVIASAIYLGASSLSSRKERD